MSTSRLNIAPPPASVPPAGQESRPERPRTSRLGTTVIPDHAPDNLSKPSDPATAATMQDMNFKVENSFHKRFKAEAVLRGLSMKELLEICFKEYLEHHGGTMHRPHDSILEV